MDPMVLEEVSTLEMFDFIINNHTNPTTLIICSSREAFIQDFLSTDTQHTSTNTGGDLGDRDQTTIDTPKASSPLEHLLQPTLHLLSGTRSINLPFCPDVPHLLAYLTLLSHRDTATSPPGVGQIESEGKIPILAILNPIGLYRSTSSFSVQGLNRFFACAVETAFVLGRKLIIAECVDPQSRGDESDEDEEMQDGAEDRDDQDDKGQKAKKPNSWDEEVSMLNVTTKTFGAGNRGWAGRTVSVRRIAGRWCCFETLKQDQGRNEAVE